MSVVRHIISSYSLAFLLYSPPSARIWYPAWGGYLFFNGKAFSKESRNKVEKTTLSLCVLVICDREHKYGNFARLRFRSVNRIRTTNICFHYQEVCWCISLVFFWYPLLSQNIHNNRQTAVEEGSNFYDAVFFAIFFPFPGCCVTVLALAGPVANLSHSHGKPEG